MGVTVMQQMSTGTMIALTIILASGALGLLITLAVLTIRDHR
jgi:hypothetical protein